jgi:hypothetical protein
MYLWRREIGLTVVHWVLDLLLKRRLFEIHLGLLGRRCRQGDAMIYRPHNLTTRPQACKIHSPSLPKLTWPRIATP